MQVLQCSVTFVRIAVSLGRVIFTEYRKLQVRTWLTPTGQMQVHGFLGLVSYHMVYFKGSAKFASLCTKWPRNRQRRFKQEIECDVIANSYWQIFLGWALQGCILMANVTWILLVWLHRSNAYKLWCTYRLNPKTATFSSIIKRPLFIENFHLDFNVSKYCSALHFA